MVVSKQRNLLGINKTFGPENYFMRRVFALSKEVSYFLSSACFRCTKVFSASLRNAYGLLTGERAVAGFQIQSPSLHAALESNQGVCNFAIHSEKCGCTNLLGLTSYGITVVPYKFTGVLPVKTGTFTANAVFVW